MGFRNGAYAKVWEVKPQDNGSVKLRISISRKNREGDGYEQDFSGFPICYGQSCANAALKIKEGDVIVLGNVDVSTRYDKEHGREYTNFKIFSFDWADGSAPKSGEHSNGGYKGGSRKAVDDGEPDDSDLPF